MVQWLGLCTVNAEGLGSIPGQGTKIPASCVAWPNKQTNKKTPKLDMGSV